MKATQKKTLTLSKTTLTNLRSGIKAGVVVNNSINPATCKGATEMCPSYRQGLCK